MIWWRRPTRTQGLPVISNRQAGSLSRPYIRRRDALRMTTNLLRIPTNSLSSKGETIVNFTGELLDRFVESQIFFPDPVLIGTPSEALLDYEDVWFDTSDEVRLHGWMVPSAGSSVLMLFCHGNAGNVSHSVDNLRRLHDIGLNVFIFDYRDYEQAAAEYPKPDSIWMPKLLTRWRERMRWRKILSSSYSVDRSAARPRCTWALGSTCSGIILESAFTHMAAMARYSFPLPVPGGLLRHKLNALEKISQIKAPVLFVHGDRDNIVPINLGRNYSMRHRPPKEFMTIEGAGHNEYVLCRRDQLLRQVKRLHKLAAGRGDHQADGVAHSSVDGA